MLDEQGEPLVGVTITVVGSNERTITDMEGNFTIQASPGASLDFTYVGFKTLRFDAKNNMTVSMLTNEESLDEIVVVGYGSSKRRDLIASVSTVKADQISNIPAANIAQGLAGRSPGLIVQASGGGVNSTPTISIRGGGTPLYVIDGIIRSASDFNNLAPQDIESMSILKDASATAIYGSRAANGIIQVQTKTGKAGKTTIDYDLSYSISQPSHWPHLMSFYNRAKYANIARTNDGLSPLYTDDDFQKILDGSDPLNHSDTNWRDEMLKKWAPQSKHNVRINGGNEHTQFYVSLGHVDDNSLYRSGTNWMKRTTYRIGGSTDVPTIGLRINASVDGYVQITNSPFTSKTSGYGDVFGWINNAWPYIPAYNNLGLPYNSNYNGVAELSSDAGYRRHKNNVANGKGELVWTLPWVKGLRLRAASNYRYYSNSNKNWRKDPATYTWNSTESVYAASPLLNHESASGYAYTNQAFANYDNQFGAHSISALFGFEQYYEKTENYWAQRENYSFFIDQIEVGDANKQTNGGEDDVELGRAAWIGQVKYNYANKYYAEGSFRYDGSDYFRKGKRWGMFYSGSLGWVVTEENFMKSLVEKNIFNSLKVRFSYGETGLDNSAGRWAYMTSYNYNPQAYVVAGAYTPGFSEGALPSPDLTWYTTRETDFGFDFASLSNRLYGSFDYFYYSTKGYLVSPTGQSYTTIALGIDMPKVKSKSEYRRAGYEINLGWRDQIASFKYDVSANFTHFNSLWARNESEAESSYMNPYHRTQQQTGYYAVMYHNLGYYQNSEDVYNSVAREASINSGYLSAGDIKYADLNGDGRITEEDQRRLGNNKMPRGQWGINLGGEYKGFYMSMLFQGSTSFDMYIAGSAAMQTGQTGQLNTQYDYQTDTWTCNNTDAQYPRLMSNTNRNQNNNYLSSDFWLVNGQYVRLKDFQLGYDLKYSLLKKITWLSRARMGISGQNIFTISDATKYGLDPENSSTANYGYPVMRALAFTLNLGF